MILKFLKKLTNKPVKEENVIVELEENELVNWFENKVAQLNYDTELQNYFQKIKGYKTQINLDLEKLSKEEISKDHKNVEERVKNIVLGHRDNYVQQINRFVDLIEPLERDKFNNLESYFKVLEFNQNLNKKLEELAKRTAKSYQAAQHLFFDNVEKIFKSIGKLNLLVKNFDEEVNTKKIKELDKIKRSIDLMQNLKETKIKIKEEITLINQEINKQKAKLNEHYSELEKLKESVEYEIYKENLDKIKEIQQRKEIKENQIFVYFSKLSKPLRKYSKISLKQKMVNNYLDNYVKTLSEDKELTIMKILEGLKKSLEDGHLKIEEKQKNKFINLLENKNNLLQLKTELTELKIKTDEIKEIINHAEISTKIEVKNSKIEQQNRAIKDKEKELQILTTKLEKTGTEKIKTEIITKIAENLTVNLSFSS